MPTFRRSLFRWCETQMPDQPQKFSFAEKAGYSLGDGLRGPVLDHVPDYPRAHTAGPETEIGPQSGFRRTAQEWSVDRHVRPHAGPLRHAGDARRHAVLLLPVLRQPGPPVRPATVARPDGRAW